MPWDPKRPPSSSTPTSISSTCTNGDSGQAIAPMVAALISSSQLTSASPTWNSASFPIKDSGRNSDIYISAQCLSPTQPGVSKKSNNFVATGHTIRPLN
ncbi:unnamed protein product [Protopolystoma xenopodis]|uniref:Uncharacterized protein n=1 Tax=Protopolystoma xenopodis TaxID=117903 RepID=A0A448WSG1_9PLAT|nr:unnamed protein product [Protopolystoma xenopodis]